MKSRQDIFFFSAVQSAHLLLGSVAISKVVNPKFFLNPNAYSGTVQTQETKELSKYDAEVDSISDGQLAKLSDYVRRLFGSINHLERLIEFVWIFFLGSH